MNAIEIYENADRKLNKSEITLGEYERMIDPLRNVIPLVLIKQAREEIKNISIEVSTDYESYEMVETTEVVAILDKLIESEG